MQTWSEAFRAYIHERFGDGAQQKAALALKTGYSKVHYWCHGSRAREKERERIQKWSGGAVSADLPREEAKSA
jgi:hypothetical protein